MLSFVHNENVGSLAWIPSVAILLVAITGCPPLVLSQLHIHSHLLVTSRQGCDSGTIHLLLSWTLTIFIAGNNIILCLVIHVTQSLGVMQLRKCLPWNVYFTC